MGRRKDLKKISYYHYKKNKKEYLNKIRIAQKVLSLKKLQVNKKILNAILSLGLKKPIESTNPMLMMNDSRVGNQEQYKSTLHQDFRSMQGSLNSIVVWIPLLDVRDIDGPIEIIPKSHKLGLLKSKKSKWYREIDDSSIENMHTEKVLNMQKGDALFFSSLLIHRSGKLESEKNDGGRITIQLRYNDLNDPFFKKNNYPVPYISKPIQERIIDRPSLKDLKIFFK